MPLQFINNSVPFNELASLYALADVCLVTSTRDGMNLVSYEFIASQPHLDPGVLIISEFAGTLFRFLLLIGAAQSFNGALIINPWDTPGLAKTLATALEMPLEAREASHQSLFRWVTKYTSAFWGMGFISELSRCTKAPIENTTDESESQVTKLFVDSMKRQMSIDLDQYQLELLVVDKGGKLLEHRPILSIEKPRPHILHLISSLASIPNFSIFVMSGGGRSLTTLTDWFESTGAGLLDSEGTFYKQPRRANIIEE